MVFFTRVRGVKVYIVKTVVFNSTLIKSSIENDRGDFGKLFTQYKGF